MNGHSKVDWLDHDLEVLAIDREQIARIDERLRVPSEDLTAMVTERFGDSLGGKLGELFNFRTGDNPCCMALRNIGVRRLMLSVPDSYIGLVKIHIVNVANDFPGATFLLEYRTREPRFGGKKVFRAGKLIQSVQNSIQRTQGVNWALPDIFQPFRQEYYENLPFGSLWNEWLEQLSAATFSLSDPFRSF